VFFVPNFSYNEGRGIVAKQHMTVGSPVCRGVVNNLSTSAQKSDPNHKPLISGGSDALVRAASALPRALEWQAHVERAPPPAALDFAFRGGLGSEKTPAQRRHREGHGFSRAANRRPVHGLQPLRLAASIPAAPSPLSFRHASEANEGGICFVPELPRKLGPHRTDCAAREGVWESRKLRAFSFSRIIGFRPSSRRPYAQRTRESSNRTQRRSSVSLRDVVKKFPTTK